MPDHVNYAVLWCLVAEIMNVLQPGRVTTNPALPYLLMITADTDMVTSPILLMVSHQHFSLYVFFLCMATDLASFAQIFCYIFQGYNYGWL